MHYTITPTTHTADYTCTAPDETEALDVVWSYVDRLVWPAYYAGELTEDERDTLLANGQGQRTTTSLHNALRADGTITVDVLGQSITVTRTH